MKQMDSLSHLLIVVFSTAILISFVQKWRRGSGKRLPPSPPKLPVIGNLHQLGSIAHRSLQSLSRRYGPVMLLHFGGKAVVVASSAEAAREIMKDQDLVFSNRPEMSIPRRLFYGQDVAFAPYGDHWRRMRSVCVLQLLSNARVQSYRRVREEETSLMLHKITRSSSTVLNLSEVLMSMTEDLTCRVVLGKKYGSEAKFKNAFEEYAKLAIMAPLWEYIPWLSWTRRFDGLDKRIARATKAFDDFLESVIREHRDGDRKIENDGGELDFMGILLDLQRVNESQSPISDVTIKAIILDMFFAGTDTTSATLEWTMTELIRNPTVMKTLQNEVREVTGSKVEIEEQDLEKMPYLKAVFKESLRLHPPIPLLVPRESTQDAKVLGFNIASGTRVIINAFAIGRDPSLWENPEEFRPERFLETSIDFRGQHFELIPFGAGRRGCPGVTFAMAVAELALAKLVHKFDFGLPNEGKMEELDISELSGLASPKKFPLHIVATPHSAC